MLNPLILAGAGSLCYMTMLKPLILTGLMSKSPILVLYMLIWRHENLYGDKEEQVSTHEQAWASMLNPLILTGLASKSPILALYMLICQHETLYGDKKEQLSTYEPAWASISKNAKSADFNRFSIKIPYLSPQNAFFDNMRSTMVTNKAG